MFRTNVVSRLRPVVVAAVLGALAAPAAAPGAGADWRPHIVNGTPTAAYPAVGALLFYADATRTALDGVCSGTLIGCETFVTAAHCVCPDFADDAASCLAQGLVDPATLEVFFQHAGRFDIASITINPDFAFAVAGDVAVLKLATPVNGVRPALVNTTQRPVPGSSGVIAGFGRTVAGRGAVDDSGIKRAGAIVTSTCASDIPDDNYLCWQFDGAGASSCDGDSGGPLFVDLGSGLTLAGIISGGETRTCLAPDMSYNLDVFVQRSWIADQAGADFQATTCGPLPMVGTAGSHTMLSSGALSSSSPTFDVAFTVPAGTQRLRVALNGEIYSGQGPDSIQNDFNLSVRAGSIPTATIFDCQDANPTAFGFCDIATPTAGQWFASVARVDGTGAVQVSVTTFDAALPCAGDCNGNGAVSIDELVTGVNIALGTAVIDVCPALDTSGEGNVTVDELVVAVTHALNGCPAG